MKAGEISKTTIIAILSALAVVILAVAPLAGMKVIPFSAVLNPSANDIESHIFWMLRVPRVMVSFMAGAALAISGMTFQAMFRNPLATPFTLGVASGASLGAALYVRFGLVFGLLGVSGQSICAFLGSLFAILLVYGLTRVKKGFSTTAMLLAGVAMSFFFSSAILFVQYLSDVAESFRILRWLMGELVVNGYDSVLDLAPFIISGCAIILSLTHELNLMISGEEIAISRGVNVSRIKKVLFFATSLMVGGVVAVCGPISFVGMMVPHICRLLIGADHRYLTPVTFLFGGIFLTLCDTLARTLIVPAEMPVGVITALLGGPFFIWLLVGNSLQRGGFLGGE